MQAVYLERAKVYEELTENGAGNLFPARSGRKRLENMFSRCT